MGRKIARLSVGAAVAGTLLLVVGTACFSTVQYPQPSLAGLDVRLTILHTSDIHSRLFPYDFVPAKTDQDLGLNPNNGPFGGAARMAWVIKHEEANASRYLHLDSGDVFEGAPVFNLFQGEPEFRALSAMGTDAAALGNHEFDRGSAVLSQQISRWATYPILAANYDFNEQQFPVAGNLASQIAPYTIMNVDGLRVGVIGLGNTDSLETISYADNHLGIRPLDTAAQVAAYSRLLRPLVDVLIIQSHMGLGTDEDLAENLMDDTSATGMSDPNQNVALDDVDVVLGGHLHIVTWPPKIIPHYRCGSADCPPGVVGQFESQTVICHSSAFAKFVGRLDLDIRVPDPNGATDLARRGGVQSFAYKIIPIDKTVPEDPEVAKILEPYHLATVQAYGLPNVFAYVNTACTANAAGTPPTCDRVNRYDPTGGDSQLGNMVATAMRLRKSVNADFALTNSLGIRDDFYYGPLTVEDMFNVFPFENTIVTLVMSGSEVQELLDYVAERSAQRGCQTQASTAGIFFDMNCTTEKASHVLLGDNCRQYPDCDQDPVGPMCPCAPLDPARAYRVAVNDYIAAGGSGFVVLQRNTSQQDTGISLRDALTDYLRNLPPCPAAVTVQTIPNAYRDPYGRPVTIGESVVHAFGSVGCIYESTLAHDGRIRPVY